MRKAREILDKVLHPPKWVLCTIPAASFAALLFIFASNREENAVAYSMFFLSAYSLMILLAALPTLAGRFRQVKAKVYNRSKWIQRAASTAFGRQYLNDQFFRSSVHIYQGMTVNFLYMLVCLVTAVQYASVWFFSMALYYMMLCIMRAYLSLGYRRRKGNGKAYELQCYRRTAGMLFLLNLPMGGMIVLMVQTNSGFSYPGYLIYLSALYTLYMMVLAIVNLVKFRKMECPILSAAKVVNFVAAMMSVLGLQTAMIARFSSNGENYRKIMNAITGGAVFLIVMVTVVVMLVSSSKAKKEVERNEEIRK